jgi:hypothetical protein
MATQDDDTSSGGFFSFRKMITATLIKILYVIGMIAITLAGLYIIVQPYVGGPDLFGEQVARTRSRIEQRFGPGARRSSEVAPAAGQTGAGEAANSEDGNAQEGDTAAETFRRIVLGLVLIVVGNIVWRIYCELFIVVFSIQEILGSIESRLKKSA